MASKAIGFLNFKFGADLSGFERAMNKAQKKLKKFGNQLQKTGKSMTMGLTLPIVGLGVASVKAFDEQAKAIAQVEAGLKSTGNQVGFTSEKLQQMAADLQKTTIFGDEEILKGATAQLLTFTNITGEQFAKTQEIALDLATRLDGDLKSASIMLGKALNDPIANLSALSRAGIQFSTEQKTLIKSLVETGKMAEAQNVILAELETQYGGSAEAAALAGSGPLKQLQNRLSDLSEQIGERLMPFIMKFTGWIIKLAEKFDKLTGTQKDNIVKWGLILAALGPVLIIIGKISTGIGALIGMFKGLVKFLVANPYIALAAGIALVVAQIGKLILEYDGLTTTQRTLNSINDTAQAQTIAQQVEVGRLTDILKDENTTLEDKERALQDLNDIAPEYYGHLDAAAIDVKALTSATEDYIDTLLTQAKVQAAQETLVDLMKEQIDLQKQYKELTGIKAVAKSIFSAIMPSAGLEQSADLTKILLRSKSIAEDISAVINVVNTGKKKLDETSKESITTTEEEININNDLLILIEKLLEAQSKLHDAEPDYDKAVKSTTSLTLATKDLVFEAEKVALMAPSISSSIEEMFPTKPLSEFSGELGRLGENMNFLGLGTIPDLEEALGSMAVQLGNNLAQGAESFKEYATAVKGMMKDVIGALISKGVAAAVSNAMEGMAAFPGSAFVIPIIAGAAAGIARTAFNSLIPEFAAGGLVTGPTTALIGEGSGTSMANPEVVAPLDKLKQYMGGGSNVTVTGRLVGNDIYLSNERTKFNRNRTV